MTDEDLAARYEQLLAASAEVVHSALISRYRAPYTPELDALYRLVLEAQTRSSPRAADPVPAPGAVDPALHSLAFTFHGDDGTSGPYALARLGSEIRAELDADRVRGEHVPDHPLRDVVLTDLRAMVIAGLLRELAARLDPGPAMGPGEAGRALAAVATECGERLDNLAGMGD